MSETPGSRQPPAGGRCGGVRVDLLLDDFTSLPFQTRIVLDR